MAPFVLPLAGILGSLWLLARPDQAGAAGQPGAPEPSPMPQPIAVTPELRAHLTEPRIGGAMAFRSLERAKITALLGQKSVALVSQQGRSQVWGIVPWAPGAIVAIEAVRTWQARGFTVC